MIYDYCCDKCEIVYEIQHSMFDEKIQKCPECKSKLRKLFTTEFYVSGGLKPTLEDLRETSHKDKVYDKERAIRKRRRAFGSEDLDKVVDKPDPKHLVRGKVLAGQDKLIDRQEFIKKMSKDDFAVNLCAKALKKQK